MLIAKIFIMIFLILLTIFLNKINKLIAKYPILSHTSRFENEILNIILETIARISFMILALFIFLDIIGTINILPN